MAPFLRNVVRLDSTPVNQTFFTSEGYLKDRPILTSTGIFEYLESDGSIRRELRLPDDVFEPASLASYEGKPIIITHDAGMVTKDNVADVQIGTILTEGYKSGESVRAKIIIHNTDEMKDCGLRELSLGYNLDLEEEPGEWNGEHYDAIQRNIRINHLALVREARAGEKARLNIDGKDDNVLIGGKVMSKIRKGVKRSDSVLSPEELEKAIQEYKATRNTQEDGKAETEAGASNEPTEETVVVVTEDPVVEPVTGPKAEETAEEPAAEQQVADSETEEIPVVEETVTDEGDEMASALEAANRTIKEQDEDIRSLLEIVDTLMAEAEYKEAEGKLDAEEETEEEDPFAEYPAEEQTVIAEETSEDVSASEDIEAAIEDIKGRSDESADVKLLINIIDTLLAERENSDGCGINKDECDPDPEEINEDGCKKDGCDNTDGCKKDEDDVAEEEDDVIEEDDDVVEEPEEDSEGGEESDDEEVKESEKEKPVSFNSDSIDKLVDEKVEVLLLGRELHLDGLNKMKILDAKKAIVMAVRPGMRLDGKSAAYINAAYEMATEDVERSKGVPHQKQQMFNKDGADRVKDSSYSAEEARNKMLERQHNKKNN